jgi:hypothetical protein
MLGSTPVNSRRISSEFKKYLQIYKEEGFDGIIWAIKDFGHKVRKAIFSIEKIYVYEMKLNTENDIPKLNAKIDGLNVKPIFLPISLQDYECFVKENVDFEKLKGAQIYQRGLHNGTIVFLTYKEETLMNRTGMTLYRNGAYKYSCKNEFDTGKTVFAGFSETTKAARMMGIYSFVHSYIYRYLKDMGFENVILLESEEQPGPRKVQDRLGAKIRYSVKCIRVLLLLNYWVKEED